MCLKDDGHEFVTIWNHETCSSLRRMKGILLVHGQKKLVKVNNLETHDEYLNNLHYLNLLGPAYNVIKCM